MAGILERFGDIMAANFNALLDKCEDPSKMIDQTLRNLNENLAEVTKETAGVVAEEKRAERELNALRDKLTTWDTRARKALASGNEGDARTFLTEKAGVQAKYDEAKRVYDVAHSNADKMRSMQVKLKSDIAELSSRRSTIKAKAAVAKTQKSINKMASGVDAAGTLRKFEDLEARVDRDLDTAMAEAELLSESMSEADVLAQKYDSGVASVDDDLARLKAEMGLA